MSYFAFFCDRALLLSAVMLLASAVRAETDLTMHLNWAPGADHAPFYYAEQQGWYRTAGIKLSFVPGAGSTNATQKVAESPNAVGIADFTNVLIARGKGADVVAVMSIFANSPHSFYWLKSSGIRSLRDLRGRKIGTPLNDPARILWRSLAKTTSIDPDSVTWVDVAHNAKIAALKSQAIDVATNSFFYNHTNYTREFGDDLVQFSWCDEGLNLYGNSLIASQRLIVAQPELLKAFVIATQRAFQTCLKEPQPCITSLVAANSHLDFNKELENWRHVVRLVGEAGVSNHLLGAFDMARVKHDYRIVRELFNLERFFEPINSYNNDFLDATISLSGSL